MKILLYVKLFGLFRISNRTLSFLFGRFFSSSFSLGGRDKVKVASIKLPPPPPTTATRKKTDVMAETRLAPNLWGYRRPKKWEKKAKSHTNIATYKNPLLNTQEWDKDYYRNERERERKEEKRGQHLMNIYESSSSLLLYYSTSQSLPAHLSFSLSLSYLNSPHEHWTWLVLGRRETRNELPCPFRAKLGAEKTRTKASILNQPYLRVGSVNTICNKNLL